MIWFREDQMSLATHDLRQPQTPMRTPDHTRASEDSSLPLLTAIATEVRLAGRTDEAVCLRIARRLLEDAFRGIDGPRARGSLAERSSGPIPTPESIGGSSR